MAAQSISDPLELLQRLENVESALGVDLLPSDVDLLPVVPRVLYLEQVVRDTNSTVLALDRLTQSITDTRDIIEQVGENTKTLLDLDTRLAKTDQKTNYLATNADRRAAVVQSEFKRNRKIWLTISVILVIVTVGATTTLVHEHDVTVQTINSRKATLRTSYFNCLQLNKAISGIETVLKDSSAVATPSLPPAQDCTTAYRTLLSLGVHDIPSP